MLKSRISLINQLSLLTRPFGVQVLNKVETNQLLSPYVISDRISHTVILPAVANAGTDDLLRDSVIIDPSRAKVWCYDNAEGKASLSRSGIVKIGPNVLNIDFGANAFYKDFVTVRKRKSYTTDLLIAPWSHTWGGYYDFLFFTLAKLCRIREVLGRDTFDRALISYPLRNTPFEAEYFDLLGFDREKIVDSRLSKVNFKQCILGNNDEWFHPNYQDIMLLRQQVLDSVPLGSSLKKRLYIRRAGRRRVLNEDALIQLLLTYGFDIIDDVPRTIYEQMTLYRSASFILGPHGASFSNILWCDPSTHLMELFNSQYVPGFYRYLAGVLSMPYSAYSSNPFDKPSQTSIGADVTVSIDCIKRALDNLLTAAPSA